jgi:phage regulator Rha-like protein
MNKEEEAKRILESDLFNESFEEMKAQLMSEWLHTAPDEKDKRESLHLQVHLADRLYAHLSSILETGQMAQLYTYNQST